MKGKPTAAAWYADRARANEAAGLAATSTRPAVGYVNGLPVYLQEDGTPLMYVVRGPEIL